MTTSADLPAPAQPQYWPEAPRGEMAETPFPMRQLLLWVIPGAAVALLLALVILIVQQQGARTVLSVAEDGALLGRGLVEYGSNEIRLVKGRKTAEIADLLGADGYADIIHRDNMVFEK